MKALLLFLLTTTALFGQLQVMAAESENPGPEMSRLIAASQYQEAFALGEENLDIWEGEPEFDFFYGLAALESGNASESVYALERVAASAENTQLRQRARLELARAYFLTNNLSASKELFTGVLASNPPENVRENIAVFLQLIEARQASQSAEIKWTIASQLGSDSNINSATSNGLIDTPLIGEIELDPLGQKTDDHYSNTLATMVYNHPLTRDRSVDVSINLNHLNNFSTDQFDIDILQAEAAYNWGDNENRFRHGLTFSTVNLDRNGFQKSVALNSSWQHVGNDGWYQTVAGSYSQIRYDTSNGATLNSLRDVDQFLVSGGLTKISGSYTHSVTLYHADENSVASSAGSHNGRAFTGMGYSLLYRLNAQHTPYVRASLQEVEHDTRHPVFFNTKRRGHTRSLTAGWFWQYNRDLMVTAQSSYTKNNSNIPLFDYSRVRYQAGIRYQF